MPHPFYRKQVKRRKTQLPWAIAILVLVIVVALPWMLPQSMSSKEPLKYVKAITTFPMIYEWTHSYKYAPDKNGSGEGSESNGVESDGSGDKKETGETLFPLAVGNKWVYEHRKTGGMMAPSEKVTEKTMEIQEKKKISDEVEIYKVVSMENDNNSFAWYFWDIEGLHTTRDDRHPWEHMLLVLKASPVDGDEWYDAGTTGRVNKVVGREEVTVPMGKFDCLLVESRTSNSQDALYRTWFAEGIGIVRQSFGSLARGEDTWELKSFTPK